MGDTVKISKSWLLIAAAGLLLLTNIVTILLWQPWNPDVTIQRKITVSGEAIVKSAPDEYQFNPYYERATSGEIVSLSQDITAKLKSLGVADDKIKVTVSDYGQSVGGSPDGSPVVPPNQSQNTLSVSISVATKALAQKVQDYLLTTAPKGLVTPNSIFSATKQKQLEDQARTKAIADAKRRADQSAAGLGAKVDKVLEINDSSMPGSIYPLKGVAATDSTAASGVQSLPIQPGQNEINYSVQVTFSLR